MTENPYVYDRQPISNHHSGNFLTLTGYFLSIPKLNRFSKYGIGIGIKIKIWLFALLFTQQRSFIDFLTISFAKVSILQTIFFLKPLANFELTTGFS